MMKNKTGLVALIVLAVATLLMVFFVLPNISRNDGTETPVATGTDAAGETAGETTSADGKQARPTGSDADSAQAGTETQAAGEGETAAETAATDAAAGDPASSDAPLSETATADAAADWVVPAFDLLRVEPDGSTVIAGRAEPNTTLEIRNGDTVLARADVGASGDFAAVFDKPLDAGDYQLTLNATDDEGVSRASEEVATISVPADGGGELLAMVSRPGEASRLITVPESGEDAAATEAGTAASDTGETVATGEAPLETAVAETATEETATAGETANADAADTAPTVADAEAASDAPGEAATETALAVVEDAADITNETSETAARPQVRVSAVELEGDRMFVAGNARPGALVRIYANDALVGETKADAEGRYVIDGTIRLPVGRHTIRADVMSEDGGRVDLRASVPFDRPEGEQVAVVAGDDTAGGGAEALGLIGGGAFDKLRAEAQKAVALLKGLYADGRVPTAEELAAARSATEFALKSLADFRLGADEGEAARDMVAKASAAAAEALSRLKALPQDVARMGDAVASIETAVASALAPAMETIEASAQAAATSAAGAVEGLRAEADDLKSRFAALLADGSSATEAELRAARGALETSLSGIVGFSLPAAAGDEALSGLARLKAWAQAALDRFSSVPAEAGKEAYREALAAVDGIPDLGVAGTGVATADGASVQPGETQTASDGAASVQETAQNGTARAGSAADDSQTAAATASESVAAAEPETVEQAPLQQSKTSVIIRRGDTLWQISRRIYGKGVRYTTIYLANADQISDPDRIIPGQVFGVPDEAASDADAEDLHRRRIQGN